MLLPKWAWRLALNHVAGRHSRPAVKWMNWFSWLGLLLGLFAWITVASVMNGLQAEIKTLHIDNLPHLMWEGPPREGLYDIAAKLREQSGVKRAEATLQTEGLLELVTRGMQGRVSGSGVLISGSHEVPAGAVYVGTELADLLGLIRGDDVILRSPWRLEGMPLMLKVAHFFKTGLYEADRGKVLVNQVELEQWLKLPGRASILEIVVHKPDAVDQLQGPLSVLSGLPLQSWRQTHAALWYSLKLEKYVMFFSVFFVILLASLAVYFSLTVRVSEKTREIGLLSALGVPRKVLQQMYMMEGFLIGGMAGIMGLLLSWLFCVKVLASGIWQMPDVYYSTTIPIEWQWWRSLGMVGVVVLLAVGVSWFPSRKILDYEIPEALRS